MLFVHLVSGGDGLMYLFAGSGAAAIYCAHAHYLFLDQMQLNQRCLLAFWTLPPYYYGILAALHQEIPRGQHSGEMHRSATELERHVVLRYVVSYCYVFHLYASPRG